MEDPLVARTLLDIQKSIGGLDGRFDGLESKVDALVEQHTSAQGREGDNDRRIGTLEGEVKTIRRVFGGLFSLLVAGVAASVAAVANWLK